jgi:hypothetical protein
MPELSRRYIVMTMATEGPFDLKDPEAPFVLKPWKDPAAVRALEAYREHCYAELAEELGEWLKVIESGPVIRGGVGTRNERHMSERAQARPKQRPTPRRRARAKLKAAGREVGRKKRKKRMAK